MRLLELGLTWIRGWVPCVALCGMGLAVFPSGCDAIGDDVLPGDAAMDPEIVDGSLRVDADPPTGGEPDAAMEDDPHFHCDPALSCDPVEAIGCDPPDACVLGPEGEAICDDAWGEGDAGEPCESMDSCRVGLGCFATREGGSVCDRLCCVDDDCAEEERCGAGVTADGWESAIGRCHARDASCDVLSPLASCEPGEACYIVSSTGTEGCRPAGSRAVDAPCTHVNDCEPGLTCRGLTSTCKRLCALEAQEACPPGEGECRTFSHLHLPDGVGLCVIGDSLQLD